MGLGIFKKIQLPHPEISLSIFLVVEKALCVAWDRLKKYPRSGFDLLSATEDKITHALQKLLFDEVFDKGFVPGFDRQVFTVITRDSKVNNYDGTKQDLMPDILIGLVNRGNILFSSQDWIFIECKPVDAQHTTGQHYCDMGIIRFVRGDYAWTMTNAMMVGYARNGFTLPNKLEKALKKRGNSLPTTTYPSPCNKPKPGQNCEIVHSTEHPRNFQYLETGQPAPDITIRHLWLKRN